MANVIKFNKDDLVYFVKEPFFNYNMAGQVGRILEDYGSFCWVEINIIFKDEIFDHGKWNVNKEFFIKIGRCKK